MSSLMFVSASAAQDVGSYTPEKLSSAYSGEAYSRHSQSKFVYFAKTSEPDFAAIDFPAFFRVDLSGSMAAPSI
jgi:hypothetical protein